MTNNLPATRGGGDLSPSPTRAMVRAQRQAEAAVFRHGLQAAVNTEFDRIDSQCLGEAVRCAADEEMRTLDYGRACAGNDRAKQAIVVDKLEVQQRTNDARIERRFG